MTNKEKYDEFCKTVYVPVFSQTWWMNAVCGPENWDVWIYEKGMETVAAMPYYRQRRGKYNYITKAVLTQNNGIIFKYPDGAKAVAKQHYEEEVINAACDFIEMLGVDVYEQQYRYSFKNWMPFLWNKYIAITRYTYVIENTDNLNDVWDNISSKYKGKIRKGKRNCHMEMDIDKEEFYREHEKVFLKQDLKCPFSRELWFRLYEECKKHESGITMGARDEEENLQSLVFLVWDENSVYQILGGNMPQYQRQDTYSYLIWKGIELAAEKGLAYDFEGSVIKRISKSFREFGGEPRPYFRIRKVFNPEIMREEAETVISELKDQKKECGL